MKFTETRAAEFTATAKIVHKMDRSIRHNESMFQANDDQNMWWGERGAKTVRPKGKGGGVMVSDFVNCLLAHTDHGSDEECEAEKPANYRGGVPEGMLF